MVKLAIWWLSQEATETVVSFLDEGVVSLPEYIRLEVRSRCGRAGRGRLWVAPGIDLEEIPWDDSKPLTRAAALCGGIVLRSEDAGRVAYLPGFVTDTAMEIWPDVEV